MNVTKKSMRIVLVALEIFVGIGAVAGGLGVMTNGIRLPVEWLQGSPFDSYAIPGLILMIAVGGSQLVAAVTVLREREWGAAASLAAGLVLVVWIVAQVVIIGFRSWLQPFFLVLGFLIFGLATRLWTSWYAASTLREGGR